MRKCILILLLIITILSACKQVPFSTVPATADVATTTTSQPTQPSTEPTTEPPTEPPTEAPTEPPTEPSGPQLMDPVEITNYTVESAYIDVLSINALPTLDSGEFCLTKEKLDNIIKFHREHEFFQSTDAFEALAARYLTETDFTLNSVAVVYFAAMADSNPIVDKVILSDYRYQDTTIMDLFVYVDCDERYHDYVLTDISKVKYHFLFLTIPKSLTTIDGKVPNEAHFSKAN